MPPVRIAETKEDNVETLVMQIEFTGGIQKVYLRFTGDQAKNRAERVKNVLDQVPSEKAIAEESLEAEQLMKMVQIKRNDDLKNFF